ncbi:MAG: GNAT family N-acetyltransferase [Phycisphaeraceae bacterium]
MTEVADSISSWQREPGVVIARVAPEHRYEALAVLLTGESAGRQAVVDHFLGFADQQRLSLEDIWTASRDGRTVAATMIVPCAGRTAMVFLSPLVRRSSVALAGALVRTACRGQDTRRVRLIQSLLDPGQDLLAGALDHAGFTRLATLVYLQHTIKSSPVPPPGAAGAPPGYQLLPWSESHRPLFERAILESYQGTRDCPGLLGLRDIDDIIDGHMHTGTFEPALWQVLCRAGEPCGVMLLNPLPQRRSIELVYLGLPGTQRGQGLGRRLLQYGIGLAQQRGLTSMICAVDADNAPAVRLYQSLHFTSTARKQALILAVESAECKVQSAK